MDAKLGEQIKQFPVKQASHGIPFFAPNHNFLDLSFTKSKYTDSASYVVKRSDFEHFFFNQIKNLPDVNSGQIVLIKKILLKEDN